MTGRQPETGLIEHLTAEQDSPAWVELFPSLRDRLLSNSPKPIGLHTIETTAPQFVIPNLIECSWGLPELAAVAGAVGTADLYAVSAAQGNDQLALTVEVVAALRRLGKSVLILTPEPIYADQLLPKLHEANCGETVRALGAGEPPNQLPAASRPYLTESVTEAGFQAVYLRSLSNLQTERTEAARLRNAVAAAAIARQAREHLRDEQRSDMPAMPTAPTAPIEPSADAAAKLEEQRRELIRLQADHDATAAKKKGLLGGIKALFGKDPIHDACAETAGRIAACEADIAARIQSIERRNAEHQAARLRYENDHAVYLKADERLADLTNACRRASVALQESGYDPRTALDDGTPEADAAACEIRLAAVERLVADLERDRAAIRKQLAAAVGVVVAPCTALGLDASLPPDRVFDHVLVIDAEQQSEADLNRFAARGRQVVLLGDATNAPRSSWFQAFVRRHADANWGRDCGKLVTRLTPLDTTHAGKRVSEPLADQPTITVEFLVTPHGREPGSITFPPLTSPAAAKVFLARELDFVRFRTLGERSRRDTPDHKQVVFRHVEPFVLHADDWIDLGDGIAELVTPGGWTAAVRFDARWTDDAVEDYLAEHIAPMSRAAVLPQPLFILERKVPKREPAAATAGR